MTRSHWHCGHEATPENTSPNKKGVRCVVCIEATARRNRAMVADYMRGMTAKQLANSYGLAVATVHKILYSLGARLPKGERLKRAAIGSARSPNKAGRPKFWPDCPPSLRGDYIRLRHNYGYRAHEAKAMLLEGAA